MADEPAHTVNSPSTHDRENGNVDSGFRHQKLANRPGNRPSGKKHNIRRGQRQKHNKNGNRCRRNQTTFSISLFYDDCL